MSQDSFTFLVTTDNHLGYKQDDHIRRKDSFMAFAEALQIARERNVDFVLLGGDLFHVNKPSSSVEHKCIKILRQHMGSNSGTAKQTTFKRISGEFSHFHRMKHANFEDPNLKVQCPILTIHGNHDDPTGPQAKSVCEKLATCGLINYFGLVKTTSKMIHVEPIVLEKNSIKIALYGIGFIPDHKLRVAIESGYVKFKKPSDDTFNILIVHQNRMQFDKNKCIPDNMFPKFFHLIIRGHEHNTQSPEKIPDSLVNGIVYQPGSTVATSIATMESGSKKVGLMSVSIQDPTGDKATRFKLDHELVALKCCRPMIFKDISKKEACKYIKERDGRKQITPVEYRFLYRDFVSNYVETLLKEHSIANENATATPNESFDGDATQISIGSTDGDATQILNGSTNESADTCKHRSIYDKIHRFKLPLLRVRLEFANKAERFDELEVSSAFYPDRVANRDIVFFKKQKLVKGSEGVVENVTFADENEDEDDADDIEVIDLSEERRDTIDVMIEDYFKNKTKAEGLKALSLSEYTNAVRGAAEDGNVISKVLKRKKADVLRRYELAINNEDVAEARFHNQVKIQDWFLEEFTGKPKVIAEDDDDIEWEED